MTTVATEVCKLLQITRVSLTVHHPEIRKDPKLAAAFPEVFGGGKAFFFGPKGEVLGLWTDDEFVACIKRCAKYVEKTRSVKA